MKVYMLKDVEKVGMNGQIITVSDGYAQNFLFPRKLAIRVTEENIAFFKEREIKEKVTAEVVSSKASMLAERIKHIQLVIKEKTHNDGKLYGSVSADEIVELLKAKEVAINKKQVEFPKAVKEVGEHKVTIKISSKLKPQLTLKVVSKEA